ncbi:hypothetical protein ABPG74_007703 [Tetrahymena malaccensis]
MDCSTFVKKCLKHKDQNINFLYIYPESADYKLACLRCLSVIQGKSYIFDLQEILSEKSDILHYWPLSQSEKCFDETLQMLQILDTEEYQKQIFQKLKDLRTKFDDEVSKIEEKLQECSSYKIKQEFHLKYKQAAQMKQLIGYIKDELNQLDQQENNKQIFKQFIKQQIENNEIENLLNYLKENRQKQETNLNILSQITESIQNIFLDPKLFKQAQDQSINQQKIEDLNIQINDQIEDLNKQIYDLQADKIQSYENYFINVKSKQSLSHNHELNLIRSELGFHRCDKCQKNNLKITWNCSQCDYDVCSFCIHNEEQDIFKRASSYQQYKNDGQILLSVNNKLNIKLPLHEHQLNLISSSNTKMISCGICEDKDILFSWNCQSCNFNVCLGCSGLQKRFSNHEHSLKLTSSHLQRYPNVQSTFCDNCKSSPLLFSWHCFQCKYDLCLDCSSSHRY